VEPLESSAYRHSLHSFTVSQFSFFAVFSFAIPQFCDFAVSQFRKFAVPQFFEFRWFLNFDFGELLPTRQLANLLICRLADSLTC
jgi:hypothetical protein